MPKTQTLHSLSRALKILASYGHGAEEKSVTELAHALFLPKSTAHRIVITLEEEGFLEQNPITRKYRLGPAVLELSKALAGRNALVEIAMPHMRALAHQIGHTIHLSIMAGYDLLIIGVESGTSRVRVGSEVGDRLVPHATASGKVLLAALSESELEDYIAATGLHAVTQATITSPDRLKRTLQRVRTEGVAYNSGESDPGLEGIAAPIRHGNEVVAAISVAFPHGFLTQERIKEARDLIVLAANRISQALT